MRKLNISYSVSMALAKREFIKYIRNKARLITSLFQSLMFLFIFGFGMRNMNLVAAGMVPQAILFTGIFSGISIVQDKMFGFFKEIIVAPVSRTTISMGKAIGGTLVASIQGIILLILATAIGFFGYDPSLIIRIISALPVVFLIGFLTTCLGNVIATRMQDFHQMQFIMTFLVFPMFFTSGAIISFIGTPFYPITLINPMTYAVEAIRYIMLVGNPAFPEMPFVSTQVTVLPFWLDIIVLASISMIFLFIAAFVFRKSEAV